MSVAVYLCRLSLLQSTVLVARSIQELCELMTNLPDYASHFVNMICRILQEYLDSCQQAYHGLLRLGFISLILACVLAFIVTFFCRHL